MVIPAPCACVTLVLVRSSGLTIRLSHQSGTCMCIAVRGKKVQGNTVRCEPRKWASQTAGKVKDQDPRWKNIIECELSRSMSLQLSRLCEANPGKWRTNLTVSSNLICNLRRCLKTFQLSALFFPPRPHGERAWLFFFLFPCSHRLTVNVKLTMLHPNLPLGPSKNYSREIAVIQQRHLQLWQRKREVRCENICWLSQKWVQLRVLISQKSKSNYRF